MDNLQFVISIFLPMLLSIAFCLLDKGRFGKLPYKTRQLIIGVAFGLMAAVTTSMGIKGEFSVNVRDASPIIAGLMFGGPAGIIAGAIGGTVRIAVTLIWNVGSFSGYASSVCTLLAGIISALMRVFIVNNNYSVLIYGALASVFIKIMHMMMIFLFQIDKFSEAFFVAKHRIAGMIASNLLSVVVAMVAVILFEKGIGAFISFNKKRIKKISEIIQTFLLFYMVVAFMLSGVFITVVQSRISIESTKMMLKSSLNDIQKTQTWSEGSFAAQYTTWMVEDFAANSGSDLLPDEKYIDDRLKEYSVQEIYLSDADGKVLYDNTLGLKNLSENEKTALMIRFLNSPEKVVFLGYKDAISKNGSKLVYVCHGLSSGGIMLVGYEEEVLQDMIEYPLNFLVTNRHIGKEGFSIVCKPDNTIICSGYGGDIHKKNLSETGLSLEGIEPETLFRSVVFGIECYGMHSSLLDGAGNEYISISMLPVSEAYFNQDLTLFTMAFIELVVFTLLFVQIYYNIKKLLVNNIQKVNKTLGQIASGNLKAVMDVRGNEEFNSLSDDINITVDALKQLIAKEAARIDEDLANAKAIQQAALPSVFPDHDEFALMASMDAAKEVGGDFYDFYMLDDSHLVFLVADVSGKGIPAAMFMMTAKTTIKNLIEENNDLAQAITKANIELCSNNKAKMFVTAWVGILDLSSGSLQFVNAGHNPPIIKRQNSEFEYLRTRPNFVIAGMKKAKYQLQEITLEPGDELFLYTDGVTEALNKVRGLYGEQRLINLFNSENISGKDQKELLEFIRQDIAEFADGAQQADDITMLTMQFKKRMEDEWLKLL